MRRSATGLCWVSVGLVAAGSALAQADPDLTRMQSYTVERVSSSDPAHANADWRSVAPGATLTVLDVRGPATLSHLWFTINDPEPYALKRIVLRMYWDDEARPSVEAPIGDFFGLGTGDYVEWHSRYLAVAPSRALNSFFPMPFARRARITVTNEGREPIRNLYYNIDLRKEAHALPSGTLNSTRNTARHSPIRAGPTNGPATATRWSTIGRTRTAPATTSSSMPRDAAIMSA